MDVIPLLVLISLGLVAIGVAFFLWSVRLGDHEHADRLALLPLEDDPAGTPPAARPPAVPVPNPSTPREQEP
ncbi:MAG: cbb3-type cytochrome oxidase assembly protein [Planctomycetes bacterium]|nr:cbb3-type cytochrome oxidase assembly protein [Planctomycetota bacterium]